jgi:hypothetical protein
MTLSQRIAPLLALLDARYFPLLFAAAPQAYTVYRWLFFASDRSTEAWFFAVVGATGFEMVYVGAIAWAEGHARSHWFWLTAFTALLFSVLVALRVYLPGEVEWAILHSGFPLTAFCYTMLIHRAGGSAANDTSSLDTTDHKLAGEWQRYAASLEQELGRLRETFAQERGALLAEFENRLEEQCRELVATLPKPNSFAGNGRVDGTGELLSPPVLSPAEYQNPADRRERVLTLRAEGRTWKEIGALFGVTDRTAQNWAREV